MHPALDKIIYDALLADRRPPTGKLHCSSASWQPLRFTQLSMVMPQSEDDYGSLMTMKIGTLTHDWLEGILYDDSDLNLLGPEWEVVATEWDLTPYLPDKWTGTADYVFVHKPTDTVVVGDLKTIKPEAVAYLGNRPKPEHVTQVSCYHAAVQKWIDKDIEEMPGTTLHPDIFVCYAPKSKDSRQQTILPTIKTATAETNVIARMHTISFAVDKYVAEVERTGELDNQFLAPMPEMVLKISWNKVQAVWDVVAREGWETEYIGSQYPEYLVPRRPSCKVGHYSPDGWYVPRKGIAQPDNLPPMPERKR